MSKPRPCAKCGAMIQIVPTGEKHPQTGKPVFIPLDIVSPCYDIDPDGNARRTSSYVSHYRTCTDPAFFSKRGNKADAESESDTPLLPEGDQS